ncbi:MAG TPA: universal stress protein [Thiobacillaceae bacterium]|nr:universal stress protein [Thiobacillaceae bacterium]
MTDSNRLAETGNLRRVLVATDGSDESAGAVRTGIALAASHGAALTGVSIALDHPEYSTFVPNLREIAEQHARETLKTFIEEAGENAEALVREAQDPARGIVDAATDVGADIIVMGQHHKGAIVRRLVGDTTAGVIGLTTSPILVVPRAARLWERKVLLATDGSVYSEAAAEAAGRIAHQARLPIEVVSVVTSSHSEARRAEAERAVAGAAERLAALGLRVDGQVVEGRPDEAIIKAAEATGADLIVVGSHGRTGLTKLFMGSVAERVVGDAACPVLVVKS